MEMNTPQNKDTDMNTQRERDRGNIIKLAAASVRQEQTAETIQQT